MSERDDLSAAIAWITTEVVGGGRLRPELPRQLVPLVAKRMVEDPHMGWPDVQTALEDLRDEHGCAA